MKNSVVFIWCMLTCALPAHLFAQVEIPCYHHGARVSEQYVLNLERQLGGEYIIGEYRTGAVMERRLLPRGVEGALSPEVPARVISVLPTLLGFDASQYSIWGVQYYPGSDACNASAGIYIQPGMAEHQQYLVRLRQLKKAAHFSLYEDNTGLNQYVPGQQWFADSGQLFENTFFPCRYPCESYVVIDNKENYQGYLAEYYRDHILADVRRLKRLR